MTSRPISLKDLSPTARDTALEASRRAGLSVEDWLNSAVLDSARAHGVAPVTIQPVTTQGAARELADIHDRLDSITRQIERVTGPATRQDPSVTRQLNDAISRLDDRLAGLSQQPAAPRPRPANPLDAAIAEVAARQNQLDGRTPRAAALQPAPNSAPSLAPNLAGFEQQLQRLTTQIEALRPGHAQIEQSIASFREELAVIRHSITEALPRRALETLEGEIRALARRIDDSRHNGTNEAALAAIERALAEIRDTLRTLRPAEQLAGFDEAIRNLSGKLDLIVRSSEHGGIRELEAAIAALRGIVAHVASGDAVARLNSDVQAIAARLETIATQSHSQDALASLEHRIAHLTEALESQERRALVAPDVDGTMRALAERIDRLQVSPQDTSALVHLEQRIATMIERIELASSHSPSLGRIEDGLSHILSYLENQREGLATVLNAAPPIAPAMDEGLFEAVRRELAEMRFGQAEADRRAQDSLDVVHGTLGQVVDRLTDIEGDLRKMKSAAAAAPVAAPLAAPPAAPAPVAAPRRPDPAPVARESIPMAAPMLPNPVQAQIATSARADIGPAPRPGAVPEQMLVPAFTDAPRPAAPPQPRPPVAPRPPIDPSLPPDHPLEPGMRPQDVAASSAAERIAASEALLSETTPASGHDNATKANFIAAARRAAQMAAAATPPKAGRMAVLRETLSRSAAEPGPASGSTGSGKLRKVLVAASVMIIVLGALYLAMTVLTGRNNAKSSPVDNPDKTGSNVAPSPKSGTTGGTTGALQPTPDTTGAIVPEKSSAAAKAGSVLQFTSPAPMSGVSLSATATRAGPVESAPTGIPATQVTALPAQPPEVTGTVAPPLPVAAPKAPAPAAATAASVRASDKATTISPNAERLPDAIGGPKLREAALKGDAAAAYEIASRYAEGKGVAQNYTEAAKWYDRAAQKGLVPAMFRLGSLYEKGLGVTKDVGAAKRSYIAAAEGGNAKAMHNLAVLFADGGGHGPDYKTAADWFRKASDHGLADSQYNLAVLYARGIGVEQNLAESYKWFSLAAAQADGDAARKRDDVAKRMDPQLLTAGQLAIQTYVPLTQPEAAMLVAAPPGGWDAAPAARQAAKTAPVRARR